MYQFENNTYHCFPNNLPQISIVPLLRFRVHRVSVLEICIYLKRSELKAKYECTEMI